jgi:hypothetical protein
MLHPAMLNFPKALGAMSVVRRHRGVVRWRQRVALNLNRTQRARAAPRAFRESLNSRAKPAYTGPAVLSFGDSLKLNMITSDDAFRLGNKMCPLRDDIEKSGAFPGSVSQLAEQDVSVYCLGQIEEAGHGAPQRYGRPLSSYSFSRYPTL